ncbi:MAG: arylesterase [Desulfuromusa sp.]|nr:arylesterase [Desulfuromusa sp.]
MKFLPKIFLVLLVFLLLAACDSKQEGLTQLRPNDMILTFGDSLTSGVGTRPELSYPRQLGTLLGRTVINAGIPGETSAEGLTRLPGVLDRVEPELLVLCHGGNDILQKLGRDQLRANLQGMVAEAKQRGIAVVMIAVPQLGLGLQDVPLYQNLADELKIPLVSEALRKLLTEQQYKSDPVHLNAQGYRKLAEAVADVLAANGALR